MPQTTITPDQAAAILQEDRAAVYLDVRSQREFVAGHPAGAINVPIAEPDPATGQMAFNPDFLAVVEKTLPSSTRILVGCMSGRRSEMACTLMERAGYTQLANVHGGFGGSRDPIGRVIQPGWAGLGLPVSTENGDGVSYASLRKKALGE